MNYRHIYHAGNFADVFKHSILTLLLNALAAKDKPFCCIDTHAGVGRYDLTSFIPKKTQEFKQGITCLLEQTDPPGVLKDYLHLINQCNETEVTANTLRFYPGSPWLIRALLRPQDRLLANELNTLDCDLLRQEFHRDRQTVIYCQDAYQCMKALLPPLERRGLILIDPPFENPREFSAIFQGLREGLERFAQGIYAIWYPIKVRHDVEKFYKRLTTLSVANILLAELAIYPDDTAQLGLNGCGMVILNPPWQFEEKLKPLLPYLWRVLSPMQQGGNRLEWLKHDN